MISSLLEEYTVGSRPLSYCEWKSACKKNIFTDVLAYQSIYKYIKIAVFQPILYFSLQGHMVLYESLKYADLVANKYLSFSVLKTVVLNIFVETELLLFSVSNFVTTCQLILIYLQLHVY